MSASLRSLSDNVLLSRIRELASREREVTLAVLDHLNEIRRRELHLRLGYASLFAYCTRMLGYSSSAAGRRIQAALCLARFPQVRGLLVSGEANVCTIAMVSRVLTPANAAEILARIRGMSQKEVQALVAEHDPFARAPRDRITAIAVVRPTREALSLLAPEASLSLPANHANAPSVGVPAPRMPSASPAAAPVACETQNYSRSGSEYHTPAVWPACQEGSGGAANWHAENHGVSRNEVAPAGPSMSACFRVQFVASPAFMSRLERVRALASHRLPAQASLEQVFALALEYFIEREDPAKRHERRVQRAEKQSAKKARAQESRAGRGHPAEHGSWRGPRGETGLWRGRRGAMLGSAAQEVP